MLTPHQGYSLVHIGKAIAEQEMGGWLGIWWMADLKIVTDARRDASRHTKEEDLGKAMFNR